MIAHLPAELAQHGVQAAIVRALRTAYEISQERHDPSVGDDPMIFGQHIWKSGSYFLKRELDQLPRCRADFVNQSLDMQIGRARLRHHKLGDNEQDNPMYCFPNHAGPASRLGPEQLEIRLEWAPDGRMDYLGWVVGSYGNVEDGLAMVCLQAVGSERALDGTISRWEDIVIIYQASAGMTGGEAMTPAEVDTVVAPEPGVELDNKEAGEDEKGRA